MASGSLTVSVRRDPAGTIAPELLTSLSPAATSDISVTIRAPGVGVYRRVTGARGDSPVEAGQPVSIGQAVGAVETLGMLNRVIAEEAGVVDQIHVADGDAVEFGQPLVTLRLS
ncbi:MAG: biotin/lipoyl-containing protein [Chloroflexota bacterium]